MVNSHCSSAGSPPPRLRQRRSAPSTLYSNSGACERPQSHSEWIHPDTDVDQPRKKYRWFGRYKPLPRADPECWRNTRDIKRECSRTAPIAFHSARRAARRAPHIHSGCGYNAGKNVTSFKYRNNRTGRGSRQNIAASSSGRSASHPVGMGEAAGTSGTG